MRPPAISFRGVTRADEALLLAIFASARAEEMRAVGWPEAWQKDFLQQQFRAQAADWRQKYPGARLEIILVDGKPAGRLYVNHDAASRQLHVIDITLLAPLRRQGIGTQVLRRVLHEADQLGAQVSLQVEPQSPAVRLYLSLGFTPMRQTGTRLHLLRPASSSAPVSTERCVSSNP